MSTRPIRLALALFAAAAFAGTLHAQAPEGGAAPHYLYFGERVELEENLDELSVGLFPGKGMPEKRTVALSGGALDVRSSRLADSAWILSWGADDPPLQRRQQVGAGAATAVAVTALERPKLAAAQLRAAASGRRDELLARTLADPDVEWAYRGLRNPRSGQRIYLTPRIALAVRSGVTEDVLRAALPGNVVLRERVWGSPDQYVVELRHPKHDDPLAVSVALARELPIVAWAQPAFVQEWRPQFIPNDTSFGSQWHLRNTGQSGSTVGADSRASEAWDLQKGNAGTVIAVIDDGVELAHPDLAGRIFVNPKEIAANGIDDDANGFVDDVNGWDFINGDNTPNPLLNGPGSHGTSVAGVAGAHGNNALGVAGSCLACRILPVRIAGPSFVDDVTLGMAISYAAQFADVLNNSWGGGSPSAPLTTAIQNAVANGRGGLGAPTLFSTGNSASGYVSFFALEFTGSGTHNYVFEWIYGKDSSVNAGLDSAWLDSVIFPGGTVETFEGGGCSGLPGGWTTGGNASWTASSTETRAHSYFGGNCSLKAGAISHSQTSWVRVPRTVTHGLGANSTLYWAAWSSAERSGTTGPIVIDNATGPAECFDGLVFNVYDSTGTSLLFSGFFLCGTWSNQGNLLADGTIAYPANLAETIAVGAVTNFDRRSDYSQWGPQLDFVAHSSGGSLGITTTDVVGANGYSATDYTNGFGGTSAASPHAAGIAALLLSSNPSMTAADLRTTMRANTRQIGPVAYVSNRNDNYGYGAIHAYNLLDNNLGLFADSFESGDRTAWSSSVP